MKLLALVVAAFAVSLVAGAVVGRLLKKRWSDDTFPGTDPEQAKRYGDQL